MSQIILESGRSRAVLLPDRGALMSSLILSDRHGTPRELLWMPESFEARGTAWPGGGLPFLFPFAGRVWHGEDLYKYALGEDSYPMPLHGFSWAKPWDGKKNHSDQATLALISSESTELIYPFTFEIRLTVKLGHTYVRLTVEITHKSPCHPSHALMPVAIGWHPYFQLGPAPTLSIPARTLHPVTPVGNGGNPEPAKPRLGDGPWVLPHKDLGSMILSDLEKPESILKPDPHYSLTISAGPTELMRHVVTWSNEPKRFICVEPWMSLPDAVTRSTECRWLKAGETTSLWLDIRCQ